MRLQTRILLAVVAPAVVLQVVSAGVVFLSVRSARLDDLDAHLQAGAGALAASIEYDAAEGGWELEDLPEAVLEDLDGVEIRHGETVLWEQGEASGRTWTGTFGIDAEGPGPDDDAAEAEDEDEDEDDVVPVEGLPSEVTVTVSRDLASLHRDLLLLTGQLGGLGLLLSAVAFAVGSALSRRIVASEDFQQLQGAWERQAAFSADASHELRTPLSVIKSRTEIALRRPREADEYRAALVDVQAAAGRMQDLVDGLLLLARAEQDVRRAPVELVGVVRERAGAQTPPEGVEVELALPERLAVEGDRRLLGIALDNLLSNALRHTRAGRVRVSLSEDRGTITLVVADTGEGIPAAQLPHLFERFYRGGEARSRQDGGAGLGLAIVQAIARAHGGEVAVESTVGPESGTTVTLTLRR